MYECVGQKVILFNDKRGQRFESFLTFIKGVVQLVRALLLLFIKSRLEKKKSIKSQQILLHFLTLI